MPATLSEPITRSSSRTVWAYSAVPTQREAIAVAFGLDVVHTYGAAHALVIGAGVSRHHDMRSARDIDDDDVLARAAALAGPPENWEPDTPERAAELREITDAMMPAQMESLAARDGQ